MKATKTIATALSLLILSGTAFAGSTHDPVVNKRQRHQQKRIVQGIRSGELTRGEVLRLEKEQARIRREERRFKADGVLTKRERIKLHRDLDRASRHIYKEKHDNQNRY
jgi:hypothetical protein